MNNIMNNIRNIDWEEMLYHSGDFFLPKPIKQTLDKSIYMTSDYSFYINGWTFVHFFSGMLVGAIYLYLDKPIKYYYYKMFIIHTIWELWQMLIGMSKPYKLTGDSNLIDTIVDTIVFMIGSYIVLHKYVNRMNGNIISVY
jgi:VanZ family protein